MAQVLPFYLLCDESYSMDGDPIQALNDALPKLHREIGTNPVVSEKAHFCIIGFSDDAQVVLPLSDISTIQHMPTLTVRGGTSFGAAFRMLKDQIDRDVADLKSQGHQVFRPSVFFLTDGYATDGGSWESDYDILVDSSNPYHPQIISFGFGDADQDALTQVATLKAFMADGSITPDVALAEFASTLARTIVKSATNVNTDGSMRLLVPEKIEGYTELPLDEL